MIQTKQSNAANYLSPITTGKSNPVNQLASGGTSFASLLQAADSVGEVSKATGNQTVGLEALNMLSHQPQLAELAASNDASQLGLGQNGLNYQELERDINDPTAVNETTMNGKLPEEEPQTAEEALQQFVGETFFGMMIKQMRSSVIKSDLMGSSNAEKMFESQFDQMMVEQMAENSSDSLSKPMYEQMMRNSNAN